MKHFILIAAIAFTACSKHLDQPLMTKLDGTASVTLKQTGSKVFMDGYIVTPLSNAYFYNIGLYGASGRFEGVFLIIPAGQTVVVHDFPLFWHIDSWKILGEGNYYQ